MDKISKIKIADDTPTHIKNATSHVYIQSLFKGGGGSLTVLEQMASPFSNGTFFYFNQ